MELVLQAFNNSNLSLKKSKLLNLLEGIVEIKCLNLNLVSLSVMTCLSCILLLNNLIL